MVSKKKHKILIIDLNSFARYPTLAIGYLVVPLRAAGFEVKVLSPLAHGVPAVERDGQENALAQIQRRIYFSTHPAVIKMHEKLRRLHSWWTSRVPLKLIKEINQTLKTGSIDAVLVSAYMQFYPSIVAIAEQAKGVPFLLGGPMFNIPEITKEWLDIPGLSAIFGGEADFLVPQLVDDLIQGKDLTKYAGIFLPDGRTGLPAPPLTAMEKLPVPDFSDFPWDYYPHRVIPVMTGRGCGWGACTFCSDIVSASGRTFRSRPVEAVLNELEIQSERYNSRDFIFLDIKLNSNLAMWDGLIKHFQERIPGGQWVGTVHVEAKGRNGLEREELFAARESGMMRISFGLETASQELNQRMGKGTRIERISQFIRDAYEAGISIRTTAMQGYPGETTADLNSTADFLQEHKTHLDRVFLSLFKPIPGTRFQTLYESKPERFSGITHITWDYRYARGNSHYKSVTDRKYRRAKARLLGVVHEINSKRLRDEAQQFNGLM
ncbi:MAG: radical SAM protein [Pseudomonadota bacterium]